MLKLIVRELHIAIQLIFDDPQLTLGSPCQGPILNAIALAGSCVNTEWRGTDYKIQRGEHYF